MVRVTATFNCRHPSADCPTDVGYIADECQPSEVMASCTIVSHRLEPKRRFYVLLAWSNTDSPPPLYAILFDSLHREVEIGVRERLFVQSKMPPLGIERSESVTHHGTA